jgi:2-methylcitrate synthase/citrate synthase II
MTEIYKGLVGVTVDETAVSKVNAQTNSLLYRGYPVQDLAKNKRFEEVAYLLWYGELPTAEQLKTFETSERSQRGLSDSEIALIRSFPKGSHPMDWLRTAISFMGMNDDAAWTQDDDQTLDISIRLWAKIPTILAAAARLQKGEEPIAPDSNLGFSENFFHMMYGSVPDQKIVKAFDISMTLYAEHSFNASTFTGRVIASSLPDIYGCVTGAIASLKGPLHGGANEAVMHNLVDIGEPDRAESWLRGKMANKELVMGFGHRVYKRGDSRVPTMTEAYHNVAEITGGQKWVAISDILSNIMVSEKNIHPNLDFPAGPTYYLMGFDIPLFTPLFVMSRTTGWTAHIREQWANNKLIRPLSAYIGEGQRGI